MPKKFHINPDTGAVSLCRAHQGKCPFGGDETHFDSIADARADFEHSMKDQTVPRTKASGLKELNEQIKDTVDPELFEKALLMGSTRTFLNLAKNPNAPADALVQAREATDDEKVRFALLKHDNFPVEKMSVEEYAELVKTDSPWGSERLSSSDAITDAHVEAIGRMDYRMIKNVNNKISQELIVKAAEENYTHMQLAVKAGRYPVQERIEHINLETFRSSISELTDVEDLASIATKALDEDNKYAKWAIASNPHTPYNTLDDLAGYSDDSDTLLRIYRNPNADESLKKHMAAKSATVASYDKLKKLDEENDGKLSELIGTGAEISSDGYRSQKRTVRLNPQKVKELGLDTTDVDTYIRHYRGNYLFGASYDAGSGVYSGYID